MEYIVWLDNMGLGYNGYEFSTIAELLRLVADHSESSTKPAIITSTPIVPTFGET